MGIRIKSPRSSKPEKASFKVAEKETVKEDTQVIRLRAQLKQKYGIRGPKNPFVSRELPELPRDITAVTDVELSRMYGEMSAYAEYVHAVLAGYDASYSYAENSSKIEDALERLRLVEDSKVPKHVKEDISFVSPAAAQERLRKIEMKSVAKILTAQLESIERNIRMLSREQSRREKEYDRRITQRT